MQSHLHKVRVGIVTVSDSCFRGEREDKSGQKIKNMVLCLGKVVGYVVVPDEKDMLRPALVELTDKKEVALLLTTGGTGISPRDITPEVTEEVIEKKVPGLCELMRIKTFSSSPTSVLSRAMAGVRGKSLIVNLPGSPKAVEEVLTILMPILPHAFEMIQGLPHGQN